MIKAEFICVCGLVFHEFLLEAEASKADDFDGFYVRCPRCGEEATLRSLAREAGKGLRRPRVDS